MKGMQHVDTAIATIAGRILAGYLAGHPLADNYSVPDADGLTQGDGALCVWAVRMARRIMFTVDLQEQDALAAEREQTGP